VANYGDKLTLTFDFQAEDAEAVLLAMEGDAFYQAGDAIEFD
jgi:hypothetical protein